MFAENFRHAPGGAELSQTRRIASKADEDEWSGVRSSTGPRAASAQRTEPAPERDMRKRAERAERGATNSGLGDFFSMIKLPSAERKDRLRRRSR
jgi:hypothetical protein